MRFELKNCHLDDVFLHGKTFDEEIARLEQVFERLRQANVKLTPRNATCLKK